MSADQSQSTNLSTLDAVELLANTVGTLEDRMIKVEELATYQIDTNLATALAKAQGEMREAVLDKVNPHFGNRYASLPSVLRAVLPALSKNNLALRTEYIAASKVFRTTLEHGPSEETREIDCPAFNFPNIQQFGSQQTYAMRYNTVALLSLIADEEEEPNKVTGNDDDGNRASGKTSKPVTTPAAAKATAPRPAPAAAGPFPKTIVQVLDQNPKIQAALESDANRIAPTRPDASSKIDPTDLDFDRATLGVDHAVGVDKSVEFVDTPAPEGEPITLLDQLIQCAADHAIPNERMKAIIKQVTGASLRSIDLDSNQLTKVINWIKLTQPKKQ